MLDRDHFAQLERRLVPADSDDSVMLLDRDFRIRSVNPAFALRSLRPADELVGEIVFDAFPDSGDDPEADGTRQLGASLARALEANGTDDMPVVRYDIADPARPGVFIPKLWSCSNTAVAEPHEAPFGILHRVRPITSLADALAALPSSLVGGAEQVVAQQRYILSALVAAAQADNDEREALKSEIEHLRRALETRDVIGQAKGMLMEQFGVDADRAFTMLVGLSQDTNIRLEAVARKLVTLKRSGV
jgi:hypothetical protein